LRLAPPRVLLGYEPQHVLVGHGAGVHESATAALHAAIRHSRRNALRVIPRLITFSRT